MMFDFPDILSEGYSVCHESNCKNKPTQTDKRLCGHNKKKKKTLKEK